MSRGGCSRPGRERHPRDM
eukprot:gene26970-biopygen17544